MRLGEDLSEKDMAKVVAEFERLQAEIEAKDAWELDRHVETAMTKLHLPPGDKNVSACSGGERRRVALCRTLLEHPDLLLLDEPTNHLDVETVRWLEETLAEYTGTVVVITHDRFFLDNVVGWMLEVWNGRAIPYEGNYSEYLIQKSKRMASQEQAQQKRAKFLDRELEWIRMNPKARATKNKSRLKNYDKMMATEVEETEDNAAELHIPAGKRLGDTIIRFERVHFSYDGEHNVLENMSFDMQPGDILGIVGPNGTGKTTCLKLITGVLEPQEGKVTVGKTVDLCHSDQERESLD
ncbi:MAG TPA: ATP-binding cassette domain-containing protein, partial [Planctomycetes bacterium]|nr:ATP-binding cassette domain-containing protein [Planctomycetota bacterium]